MRKKHSYLQLLIAVVLCIIMPMAFTGCGDDGNGPEGNSIVGKWVDGDEILTLGKDGSYREDSSFGQYRIGTYSYNPSSSLMVVSVKAIDGMNSAYQTTYLVQSLSATTLVLMYIDGDIKGYYTRQ